MAASKLTLLDGAARLAELMPHRLIWFPEHNGLRISLVGQHDTSNPCADAFLDNVAHHGMLQCAIQQECEARGWPYYAESMPHPKLPGANMVIYTPRFNSGHASDITLATVRAMVSALEDDARHQEAQP